MDNSDYVSSVIFTSARIFKLHVISVSGKSFSKSGTSLYHSRLLHYEKLAGYRRINDSFLLVTWEKLKDSLRTPFPTFVGQKHKWSEWEMRDRIAYAQIVIM
eukprot:Gregarina_sp_Poly_1__3271@NODE_1935_length_3048_cov_59_290171_g1246_i0_p2_GENE_NODE_1935_length_3048_cov_59_290171_g1246_i0NODE_1935_length_3048_cov_59_290171_g1246_i0_p2_ORF_typecomplete_len102_score7_03HCNGP/PF07818_13/0_087_NODE_1935_length_3048_cov_59_290171_g1246_i026983003